MDRPGLEPESPPRQGGVLPLDDQPVCRIELQHAQAEIAVAFITPDNGSLLEVRPGIEPGLRPYHGRVLPKHPQTRVIPAGIEPALSCLSRRRLGRWTTGSSSDRCRIRTCKIATPST